MTVFLYKVTSDILPVLSDVRIVSCHLLLCDMFIKYFTTYLDVRETVGNPHRPANDWINGGDSSVCSDH